MARKKKVILSGITRDEMEEAMHSYAVADAKQRALMAEMDGKLSEIREQYSGRLQDLDMEKDEAFEKLQAFATENRDEHFSKRKSMETTHGTLGFRIGNPQLKPAKGMTWAGILELLKMKGKGYIRTVEEVAKDKLLAERELDECRIVMEACHISVVQKETFYVEPKSEG
ncbi:MAG: host-nuclease inhibitor Gam family protein [Muribaculaceae bacterium]|nr:host-nuclease inhibitor Gam family protein [Muribaculaceae bacterium]MDE7032461.1 host-nuclease inhibitor Gam family protein [Muribaculaceae bacterium]